MSILGLPDCGLIRILEQKASARKDISFPFLSILDTFRERVSTEMKYMQELFPQYVPHDEENHLNRLFFLPTKS